MKGITPVLVGRGMAGRAIAKSLAIVSQIDPGLGLSRYRQVERDRSPSSYINGESENVLFLANPSALHAASILEGVGAGFTAIAAEKPVCVRPEELVSLRSVDTYVSVYHGYRTLWGVQTIKRMIDAGELGEVFSFESCYWQSSSAQKALTGKKEINAWKNNPRLNGPRDALTDLGSHVVDICLFIMAERPVRSRCRLFYRNSEAAHRDTHVHLWLDFPGDRHGSASISKTLHGAGNDFEFTAIGTKGAATWSFMRPDEVVLGSGNQRKFLRREIKNSSSDTAPFHGLGWLEGYVEITHQTLRRASGLSASRVPTLKEALDAMEVLLNAEIEK